MVLKILKSVAGRGFSHAPGAVVDLDDDEALRWIRGGLAEPVREEEPETASVRQPEAAAKRTAKARGRRAGG